VVVVAALVASGPSTQAIDLRNVLNGYSLTSWGTNDGLPWSEVLAITQDADGFLWLGTDGGLVRFDGTRFTAQAHPPEDRSVRALHLSANGELWAGLGESGGVLRFRPTGPGTVALVENYGVADGLGAGSVRALAADADGSIWAGHVGGLYRFTDGRWTRWESEALKHAEVHSLLVDERGRLLVGTLHGVLAAPLPDRRTFSLLDAGPVREEAVTGLSVDESGDVWRTDRLHGFQGPIGRRQPLVPNEIARGQRLLRDREGYLWVGTGGQGLWRVSLGDGRPIVEQTTVTTGLLGNGVASVFQDRDGNIWAGTLDGLNRLTRYVATPVQGLGLVSGVEVSPAGVWVMTADSLQLFPRGGSVDAPVVKYRGDVRAMHADESGRLWMSTGDTLSRFDGAGRHRASLAGDGLRSVSLIASDRQGGLWLYDAQKGLYKRSATGAIHEAWPASAPRARLAWMDTTRTGALWMATTDGRLIHVEPGGRATEYGPAHGLDAGVVRSWHVDDEGTLWAGSAAGLSRLSNGRFATLRETHGHRLEALTGIVEDEGGQLWAGIRSGLLRLAADDFDRRLASPADAVPLAHLTKADGLAGSPRWYGHRGAIRDARGRFWFVTSRGLSIVDPSAIGGSRPIEASVDSIVVDGQAANLTGPATLAAGTRRLDIQFTALALTSPATIRFRYRLDGFDAGWVDAGPRSYASYTNLSPGDYRFHVMATNTDGTWPDRAASWGFAVEPMFYQTTWFYAASVAGVLGLVALVWRLHVGRVRAEMSILLAERARVAREIHDTLLQGLFGVALRCDAIAAEVETTAPQLSAHFTELRHGVEQYVREARQSILGLRSPALERLGLATALRSTGEQLTAGTPVRFVFESTGPRRACRPDLEEHLLRIGQEAITNAVRHAHATAVRAELRYASDGIVLRVSDDGRGVDPGQAERAGALGLAGMRERARAAGGVVRIESAAGRGTSVEVRVPYERTSAAA
jgi:signal transduction histidine kinase/ligand-binding sensor domain-containing protein